MQPDATVITDPSSVPTPQVPAEVTSGLPDLATQSPQERREWLSKGTPFVEPKKEPKAADSVPAPSTPEESTPSSDANAPKESSAPAEKPGETVAAPEVAPKQGKKGKAEDRVAELLAERHELRTRIEALERGAKKPAEPPAAEAPKPAEAKVETEKDGRPKRPAAPKLGDFATYDEYETAVQEYAAEFEKYEELRDAWLMGETRKTVEKEWTAKQQKEADKKVWGDAVKEHGAELQEWADTVIAAIPEVLQVAVGQLENWAGVTKYLATNPDQLKALADKFKANPYAAVAELGKIEASLVAAKTADPPPAQPKHTKASPPPTDIAARNAAPVDARKAAIEAGDFTSYRDIENARELAARKRA